MPVRYRDSLFCAKYHKANLNKWKKLAELEDDLNEKDLKGAKTVKNLNKLFDFGHRTRRRSKKVGGIKVTYWKSTSKRKKWMTVTPSGRKVHWGDKNMKDYTQHHNKKRRSNYKARHAGIRLKNGLRAIDKKWSPAWLSYHVTW